MSTPPFASSSDDGPPTRELSAQELAARAFADPIAPAPSVVPVFDPRASSAVAPGAAAGPGPATGAPVTASASPVNPFAAARTAGTAVLEEAAPIPPAATFTPSTFGSGTRPAPVDEAKDPARADLAPTGRRRPPRHVLVLAAVGLLAASAGVVLLTGTGADESALAPVVSASSAAPTTAPADTTPTGPDAAPAVGSTRNVFAPLVAPAEDGGAGSDGASSAGTTAGGLTDTGATATAPVVVTVPAATPTATSTGTATSTATTPAPGPTAAAPAALTALWTGTTTVGDIVAQTLSLSTASGSTTVAVVPGGAVGTAAPLSWITSQGVGADGVLTLVAGTTRYQLTSGVPLALF